MWGLRVSAACFFLIGVFTGRTAFAQCTSDGQSPENCAEGEGDESASRAPSQTTARVIDPTPMGVETPIGPQTQRRSQALVVGGIVSLSVTPIALLAGAIGAMNKDRCEWEADHGIPTRSAATTPSCSRYDGLMYGGLIAAPILAGAGLTMLLLGVQRVPVGAPTQALTVLPWSARGGGGLSAAMTF